MSKIYTKEQLEEKLMSPFLVSILIKVQENQNPIIEELEEVSGIGDQEGISQLDYQKVVYKLLEEEAAELKWDILDTLEPYGLNKLAVSFIEHSTIENPKWAEDLLFNHPKFENIFLNILGYNIVSIDGEDFVVENEDE